MDAIQDDKRIAINTLFLYFRQFIVIIISLYTSRLVLKELGVEDYGIYNVIGGLVSLLLVISGSLSSSVSRFYAFELGRKDSQMVNLVFSTSISLFLLLAIIIFLLGELLGTWAVRELLVMPAPRLYVAYVVLHMSIISFVFNLLSSPFTGFIMAYEKMSAFAFFGLADAVGKLIIAYCLQLTIYYKLEIYAILQASLSLLLLLFYIVYCRIQFNVLSLTLKLDKKVFFLLSKYATWTIFGTMSYVGYTYGYNIILNIFFGPVVNAARGISVQVQSALMGFANNLQASMNPQIIKNYANNNLYRMHTLVFASSRYSFFLMLVLSLPVILEADVILAIWLVETPSYTAAFVRIALFTICIEVLSGPLICSQNATGNIKCFQIATGISMLLSLPVCYFAFKKGASPVYLYYFYLLFNIITLLIRIIIACPSVGISIKMYFKEVIVNVIIVSFLSFPLPFFLYYSIRDFDYQLIIVCLASVINVSLIVFFIGMKKNERVIVTSKIQNYYQKYLGEKYL